MAFEYITEHKDLKYKVGDSVIIDEPYRNEVSKDYCDHEYTVIGIKKYPEGFRYSLKAIDGDSYYIQGIEEYKLTTFNDICERKMREIE